MDPGCTAPCMLCAREIIKYDLKVCCLLDSGQVFCGRLSDPGAPPAKVTSGQRSWLTHWDACKRKPSESMRERERSGGGRGGGGGGSAGRGGGSGGAPPMV